MSAALVILALFFLLALGLGIAGRRGKEMDLEQWSVGGRGFGSLIVFLLLAGEIYTTFTFLGASGYSYKNGGAAYYILCYGALAYVISYWLAPAIWRYGQSKRLLSQPDWFISKYNSRMLGTVVAILGVIAMVPYLELQLKGLGIIVQETSYGRVSATAAVWIGALGLAAYVTISGIHAAATNAIVKDVLVLIVVIAIGIYLPIHTSGSIEAMLQAVNAKAPGHLVLSKPAFDPGWFITSVLLSALGFFMWPHYFSAIYSSKDQKTFRRNAALLPIYQLVLLFVIFVGFTAFLVTPGLANGDLSLLAISRSQLPSWAVGFIGAAGMLCALVPGAMLLTTCATLIAQNVLKPLAPSLSGQRLSLVARAFVPIIALVALYLVFNGGDAIVNLLLLGYAFVTQLFPSMVLSLLRRNPVSAIGAAAGMVVGAAIVTWLTIGKLTTGDVLPFLPSGLHHLNVGMVALVANVIVMAIVSAVTGGPARAREVRPAT
ncbi:sodium:solute symporter family protein [Calidifontibacter sp. DB0510]|uniref:Sodium:solute symporter family protein n=1 Tax=Metallococcus carri TaxID=1656884 RepID=A0A967AZK6_9MICO|nr:sodium:solute symporter family protein [Metallococcus carri]NHN56016.1 sodium:solute symporter family protein [Metallococcus carri]NOP37527.1 sodium:solute symporter family protein [Calidifontibacter sp. DB2511S]